jgi:hypothetical protein
MSEIQVNCRICGNKDLSLKSLGETRLVCCNNCGIISNLHFPEKSNLDNYYKTEYVITPHEATRIEQRRIFRLPEQISLIADVLSYRRPPATILDYGCDKGFFLMRHEGMVMKSLV